VRARVPFHRKKKMVSVFLSFVRHQTYKLTTNNIFGFPSFFFFCKENVFSMFLVRPRSEEAAAAAAAAVPWTRRSLRARLV
jgi:hypothetical protein